MKPAGILLLAALVFGPVLQAAAIALRGAPSYSVTSIVNSADYQPVFAPNTIATIYGKALAYTIKALAASDVHNGTIPSALTGTGVRVLVGGIPAGIYYVSPTQINFLIPSILIPGPSDIQLVIDGLAGPDIPIQLTASAPAFFMLDAQNVIATRADGSVMSPEDPAKPGDITVLYVNGLGSVTPPLEDREVSMQAQPIQDLASLQVLLNGVPTDPGSILYAGVSPGFAGLYQINVRLPDSVGANPEIRIVMADQMSPAGLTLPLQP